MPGRMVLSQAPDESERAGGNHGEILEQPLSDDNGLNEDGKRAFSRLTWFRQSAVADGGVDFPLP